MSCQVSHDVLADGVGPATRLHQRLGPVEAEGSLDHQGARYATRLTTTTTAIEMAAASSRTQGSDSQMETPSQPGVNLAVTVPGRWTGTLAA